jgi:Cd2+/Zn2+-exporting ATPase
METPVATLSVNDSTRLSFFERYRSFLLSRNTILTLTGGLLLVAAALLYMLGRPEVGHWVFLVSALIGGIPLFLYAARGLIVDHDITAGVMASAAMIAAIIVGEYSAAALVVFMMSIGEWLENLTVARADNALKDLARLIPATVTVRRNGDEIVIPIEEVTLRDIVLVRTGERIGVDGLIVNGRGSVNQAAITGESMPVEKDEGDEVFAGTLNELGTLEVQVTKLGEDTTLGQIVRLVKEAQASQAPVQRLANRYARYLVPITFSIAIVVGLITGDIMRSVTVLVVVCPCALVLATPTAVVAAIGNAAKRGMLVKSGASIEQIGKVDVVAFDKTGTLTYGKPVVQEVVSFNELEEGRILQLAATAERFSEHPIGRSIVQAALERSLELGEPDDFEVLPGFGVSALVDGHQVVVGKRALLAERQVEWAQEQDSKSRALEEQGFTVISLAMDGEAVGLIALADAPREEAKRAVAEIKALGVKQIIMITGDNARTAKMIADELGLDHYYAEVLPQRKLEIIRQLQAEGKKVAFAGDGVNDAPALAAADIGIAMGVTGTDVALETADLGLMQDEIERVPQVLSLSRRTLKVVRQNIIFSMSMNLLSLTLGSLGIIGPVIGALLHECSSLPVLANSARLVDARYRPPTE